MPKYDAIAAAIQDSLGLKQPAIAVSLLDAVPAGVPEHAGNSPAGCTFWEEAASGAFTTSARDHALCAIGIYTLNMAGAPPRYEAELHSVLKVLSGLEYVRDQDVARIPVLKQQPKHIVYAPLSAATLDPDVVLVFADARQGLVVTEAVQQVDDSVPPAMGRPACAAIPQAVNSGNAAMSLGCCGARAYIGQLSDGVALWALPGAKIEQYAERIAKLAAANDILRKFHGIRKTDVESGRTPTYAESMGRLQSAG